MILVRVHSFLMSAKKCLNFGILPPFSLWLQTSNFGLSTPHSWTSLRVSTILKTSKKVQEIMFLFNALYIEIKHKCSKEITSDKINGTKNVLLF